MLCCRPNLPSDVPGLKPATDKLRLNSRRSEYVLVCTLRTLLAWHSTVAAILRDSVRGNQSVLKVEVSIGVRVDSGASREAHGTRNQVLAFCISRPLSGKLFTRGAKR
jgi:hypothetical protein